MRFPVVFEYALDVSSNRDRLHRIAKQVADHANAAGVRKLDKHRDVRTMVPERLVRGMPDALPTEDPAARLDLGPFGIEGVAVVTQPFRSELPCPTMATALYE